MDRRESIKTLALVPLATALGWSTPVQAERRAVNDMKGLGPDPAQAGGTPYEYENVPKFFTDHEFETVGVLSDWVIPADDRSGSATDANVPAFIDFMMIDQPWRQTAIRGGLAWMDGETNARFDAPFVDCSEAQQQELLDVIAYPESAPEEMRHGVQFFNHFRDLVASGFWTTQMGIEDLGYVGNQFVQEWTGCPDEVQQAIRNA